LEELKALASRGPFYNFFIKHGATLIQISGGSIHPSNDPERKTIPSGFLFAGRIWTPGYLKEIGELTGTDLMILDAALSPMRPDSIMQEDFKVINFKSMNGWNNQPQAILSSTGNVEIARTFHHDSRTNLLILAISLVISLAFVSLILIYIINRPLKLLISSLMADDPEPIGKLINQRSEFGHIAGLMSDFFLQKKKLMEEIEERIKIEKELIVAKDKAEESDRLKSAFLNNISHEIRTPMNAIVGFSELIDDPRISEEERSEFTGIIRDSSYRLMGIISDLISLSTVESGQEIINEEAFHLNDFMHGILKKVKSTSNPSDVNIFLDVALKDDHSQIMTDKSKLNQILTHLLRNSVKFTSEGRIDFGYTMRKAEIEFFVKDTGIGIPPDKFETIFAKFQQADDSTSRQFGGAGLGLPISKAYVELLGGQLWLKSIVGEGTQFYFTIPFKTPV
jgi:signal transduction histidine kinase